jgi:hypothetical protein
MKYTVIGGVFCFERPPLKCCNPKLNIAGYEFKVKFILSKSLITMTTTLSPVPKKLSKKQVRKMIYEKLSGALAEYRAGVKEKKFETHLKQASKLFASDIAKTIGKKKEKTEKKAKKKDGKKAKSETTELQANHA